MQTSELVQQFERYLCTRLPVAGPFAVPAMPGAAEALTVWTLSRLLKTTVVWVAGTASRMETMHSDMTTLSPEKEPVAPALLYYPAWDIFPSQRDTRQSTIRDPDVEIAGQRLKTLLRLLNSPPDPPNSCVVITSIRALLQKTVAPSSLRSHLLILAEGQIIDPANVRASIVAAGYRNVPAVEEKGTFAVRGCILDVWPPTHPWPARIEWTGSQIETLRLFDPGNQRSVERLTSLCISPAGEWPLLVREKTESSLLLSYLPPQTVVVWSSPDEIAQQAEACEESIGEADTTALSCSYEELRSHIANAPALRQVFIGDAGSPSTPTIALDIRPLPVPLLREQDVFSPDLLEQRRQTLLNEMKTRAIQGERVVIFFDTQGSLDHFIRMYGMLMQQKDLGNQPPWQTTVGILSDGFVSESMRLAVVAEANLYGRRKLLGRRYDPGQGLRAPETSRGESITNLTDIEPGDLVVHVDHGVGRYEGMFEIEFNGETQEVLSIEYADGARLHVPVSQAHLLTRYVGLPGHRVTLHRLGTKRWSTEKAAAERAILDFAASLLETQAKRQMLEGHRFAPDTPWQHDFEASFPYRETPDQQAVIREVKADMESPRPMDRLVCGDAGYGKTEIAMRAAFKAVMEGKQVAVLVPTTVLAQQHLETFTERMAGYPIRIAMLSRFCSPSRRVETIKGLADGTLDVVIGTHALLDPDVRF
ncbi:MAG: DEAD/DEAH box helicase, partial [Kiritimatiellae bacterium]|nr:DEAD/DEAH box helicase [Kiritimatiellia bacterium]